MSSQQPSPPWRYWRSLGRRGRWHFKRWRSYIICHRGYGIMRLSRMREALIGINPDRTDWVKTVNALPDSRIVYLYHSYRERNFIK
uniref:Uncharacterized protein n=1 Tax=Siphoviridae sp. ctPL34 TaxID=2826322 RepID=A0A8S5LX14_9CAUD|nr:MAG TPA: hypothetical protein [Siphoviridae sp. ctPL34]